MNILQALGLGVLQGITEFLPVSSSGHLVLAQHLFGLREPQLLFDVAVHVGTLMAVLVVFGRDLLHMLNECISLLKASRPFSLRTTNPHPGDGIRMVLMIMVGSVPTAIIGLSLRNVTDQLFSSPTIAALGLWVTGALLIWSHWPREHRKHLVVPGVSDALLVGLVQGAAIIPGVSRSGATITIGLVRGLKPELAFRFSFLLSIPAILGALALEAMLTGEHHPGWHVLAAGFFSAFLVGLAALRLLMKVVGKGKLFYFAPYCFVLGAVTIITLMI